MYVPLAEEHLHLLHEIGTRNSPRSLGIHLTDRDNTCLDLICPSSKHIT